MLARRALLALLLVPSLLACDGPAGPSDAGRDAGHDAGGRDAGHDAGPACTLACGVDETCCAEPDGTSACVTLRNDPHHCGLCQIDCVTSHRGDSCDAFQCTCGSTTIGCTGNRQSYCCPAPGPGTEPYCTDLDTSPSDCGGCGIACDPRTADRCDGGHCVCGGERSPCAGTPESICCTAGADVGCVDVTSDPLHCGGCNHVCPAGQRCEAGSCTIGAATCSPNCQLNEVCCNGTCCAEGRCIGGVCGGPIPDGGVDAG